MAARDQSRAEAFAAEHGIGGVSSDYAALIAADDVDVVYNPLPMSLHAEWTIAALRAGKHVLCEKSLAANAAEAAEMVRVAAETGQILGEAVHYRYHPLFDRVLALMAAGVIGDLERVVAIFSIRNRPTRHSLGLRHGRRIAHGSRLLFGPSGLAQSPAKNQR